MEKQEIDVKIITRESIKPSSPTPQNHKTLNLSIVDQLFPSNMYPYFLAFYSFVDNYDRRVRDLKSSLSETLTRFYHLAGRIIENEHFIDCSGDGAEFIEANVSCNLADILKKPDMNILFRLVPTEVGSLQGSDALLLVQANLFECGGLALCVSVSHKVADAWTVGLFIKEWAARARGANGEMVASDITALASRFPAVCGRPLPKKVSFDETKSYKTTRFVFDSKSIDALKAKATSLGLQRPSRVEVVTAHIWLSTLKLSLSNDTRTRYNVVIQPINLRKRIDPPLSDNACGNVIERSYVQAREHDNKAIELKSLIGELRRGFQSTIDWYAQKNPNIFEQTERFKGNEHLPLKYGTGMVVSSVCRFEFYKNSDFGWGEPVWVNMGNNTDRNESVVVLVDTKNGDGIEAWATLEDHAMDLLEVDQDFLEFASVNPSVDLC